MREKQSVWFLPGLLFLVFLLTGWATLKTSQTLVRDFSLAVYLLANMVVFLDAIDFFLRLYLRRANAGGTGSDQVHSSDVGLDSGYFSPSKKRLHLRPYGLIASIYNAEDYLDDFLEVMEPFRNRTWIIDDASSDQTYLRLHQAGLRCIEGRQNRKKPGALRVLLGSLPSEIETIVVFDPDITIRNSGADELSDLETVIFDFQRSGMAALCPRLAIKPDGFLARFQALEYCMAFSLGRASLGDHSINSGISIYRRDALALALERHSLSVYAEDLENSLILLGTGERIYYDSRLVVCTEGKRSFRGWFSQRVGWSYGLIKVYFERLKEIQRICKGRFTSMYQFFVYLGVFSLLMQPLRVVSLALLILCFSHGLFELFGLEWVKEMSFANPVYFVAGFAKYAVLCVLSLLVAVPRKERGHVLPVVPLYFLYAALQTLPVTIGYANWFALRLWGRRIVQDHFQDEAALALQHQKSAAVSGEAV